MRMLRVCRGLGLSLLAIALVGCGGSPSASKPSQGAGASATKGSPVPKVSPIGRGQGELVQLGQVTYANWGERDAAGERRRGLDAGDFYFKGTFIQGDPGQTLTFEINNVAGQVHNLSIPGQGVDQDIPPGGARVNVDVTFPVSGGVQFFCKYHTARGMNGLLLVGDTTPQAFAGAQPVTSPQPGASPSPVR
jgi:plastocyanin